MSRMHREREQDSLARRAMEAERHDAKERYLASAPEPVTVSLRCTCDCQPYPHELSVHDEVFRWIGLAQVRKGIRVRHYATS